ncbi:MAG: 30S ribosomal protein S3ae, partial [Candidatus Aenigmarchaeota archaeon]|nr:30S ribosomal protein S3ae [Candidatus Aenigmarchaeota archaeon]
FEETRNYCKGKDLESIVNDIFSNKMQRQIFQSAKSIYPLQSVEIRKTEVLK